MTPSEILERGRRVIRLEREALADRRGAARRAFARAVEMIAQSTGRVIVAGVGKSGLDRPQDRRDAHVDRHAGDVPASGRERARRPRHRRRRRRRDPHLQERGVRRAARRCSNISRASGYGPSRSPGEPDSALARLCDVALDAWVREEACPHDLAPTTSTTAALALGDALAVALLEQKGFRARGLRAPASGRRARPAAADAGGRGDDHRSAAGAAAGLDAAPGGRRARGAAGHRARGRTTIAGCRACSRRETSRGSWNTRRTCCPFRSNAS